MFASTRVSINFLCHLISLDILFNFTYTELKCEKMKYCNSEDLDQSDGCSPQDCTIKFSGNKNFFNHDCNKCEKVPECVSSAPEIVPDLVYSIISNQCKNMNNSVTKDDLEQLENKLVMTNYVYNLKV